MKSLSTVACVALIASLAPAGPRFGPPGPGVAAQEKMKTFQLVLLRKGSASADKTILDAHGAYMMKLGADGVSVAAGPFTDGGDIMGAVILRAATADKAREVEAEDPAVKAGMFIVDVMPFMSTDEGQFQPWPKPFAQEIVYFGFLKSGPNRSQDKETAAQLQKEHLAYMDGQWKLGKLLAAGPFVDGGVHRGIVIYRAESPEEAKSRAEADPMVKAGRLVVELHPWRIPKGALK